MPTTPVQLICIDAFPGVDRFIGLGQLTPEMLRALWPARHRIAAAEFHFGQQVWRALTQPNPTALHALARAGTPLIPPMAHAVMRHLQELPSTDTGLSLVERITLELLASPAPFTLPSLFRVYMDREALPFLGDTMFAFMLMAMAHADDPAVVLAGDHERREPTVTLSATGRAILAGERDWLTCNPRPRWVGGVEIVASSRPWRVDQARQIVRDH